MTINNRCTYVRMYPLRKYSTNTLSFTTSIPTSRWVSWHKLQRRAAAQREDETATTAIESRK